MTRLPILVLCLVLSGTLAAQTRPLEQRPAPARHVAGDSQKMLGDQAAMDLHGEWWQLTASLTDRDGRPWTLEWALHRKQPSARGAGNAQATGSGSLVHVSITTPDGAYHEQRFASRDHAGTDPAALPENSNYDHRQRSWEWVSQGEALLPARLSFSVGERDVTLLLEAAEAPDSADAPAAEPGGAGPLVRVRGFVDRGVSKTYLRGRGRLDRDRHTPLLAGKPSDAGRPVTRISSPAE